MAGWCLVISSTREGMSSISPFACGRQVKPIPGAGGQQALPPASPLTARGLGPTGLPAPAGGRGPVSDAAGRCEWADVTPRRLPPCPPPRASPSGRQVTVFLQRASLLAPAAPWMELAARAGPGTAPGPPGGCGGPPCLTAAPPSPWPRLRVASCSGIWIQEHQVPASCAAEECPGPPGALQEEVSPSLQSVLSSNSVSWRPCGDGVGGWLVVSNMKFRRSHCSKSPNAPCTPGRGSESRAHPAIRRLWAARPPWQPSLVLTSAAFSGSLATALHCASDSAPSKGVRQRPGPRRGRAAGRVNRGLPGGWSAQAGDSSWAQPGQLARQWVQGTQRSSHRPFGIFAKYKYIGL